MDSGPQFLTSASVVDKHLNLERRENAPRTFYGKKLVPLAFARGLGSLLVKDSKPYHHPERWLSDHPGWISGDTKAKVSSNVQAVFNWAERRGLIPKNPFGGFCS